MLVKAETHQFLADAGTLWDLQNQRSDFEYDKRCTTDLDDAWTWLRRGLDSKNKRSTNYKSPRLGYGANCTVRPFIMSSLKWSSVFHWWVKIKHSGIVGVSLVIPILSRSSSHKGPGPQLWEEGSSSRAPTFFDHILSFGHISILMQPSVYPVGSFSGDLD